MGKVDFNSVRLKKQLPFKVSILGYVKFQGVQNTLERLFLTIQYLDPLKFSHWFSRLSLLRLARVKRMEAKSRSHDDEMLSLVVFWGFAESNWEISRAPNFDTPWNLQWQASCTTQKRCSIYSFCVHIVVVSAEKHQWGYHILSQ